MQIVKATVTVVVLATSLILSGCPATMSSGSYSRGQVREAHEVQLGQVESVRNVLIEGTKSGVGTLGGAALGGLAGSNIGRGTGSVAGSIGGAIVGGLVGSAIEEGVTRQPGLEIRVRLENGHRIAVTQAADVPFYRGDQVQVLTSYDGTARVVHD